MSALFSDDEVYRYSLSRDVDELLGEGTCVFVGLNPSTADAVNDDPTIRRCVRFSRDWGYARLVMVNLFAFRATNPRRLLSAIDPVGPENDRVLEQDLAGAAIVIAAWGAGGNADPARVETVLGMIAEPYCLGVTELGMPRHPLYLPASARPIRFTPA